MYKKVILALSCICLLNQLIHAEDNSMCKIATDSANTHFSRGEMAFYLPSKTNSKFDNYIRINKDSYQKSLVRNTQASKDSSKLVPSKFLKEAYQSKMEKSQPLDTSLEFKRCYNKAFQPKLDSIFKCDFFRKADSILMTYDKAGKGYSGVDFPGGAGALQKYLDKNVTLPKNAKPNDTTDKAFRVFYSFCVDEKGALSDINLLKSNCIDCEAAVLDAISKLPTFIPAKDGGKPKKIKYIMPYIKAYRNIKIKEKE